MSQEAMKLALEALEGLEALLLSMGLTHLIVYGDAEKAITNLQKELEDQPAQQEPVAAAKKDAVFAASIEFIGTLTGMQPPPIEVAPPEIFKPFRDFTEKVCLIFSTSPPPQRKPLTHEQRVDLLAKFEPQKHEWHAPAILIDMVEAAHGIKGDA